MVALSSRIGIPSVLPTASKTQETFANAPSTSSRATFKTSFNFLSALPCQRVTNKIPYPAGAGAGGRLVSVWCVITVDSSSFTRRAAARASLRRIVSV